MEITHELMLDLQQTGNRQTIYAKRGDSLTRSVKIRLYDGGTEFTVPSGIILQIAYAKSDGKGGLYDTLPDGSAACTASGNEVTAKLHPQMFTVAGLVAAELRLVTTDGEQVSTFSWYIMVQPSAADGAASEDYYKFASLDSLTESVGDLSELTTSAKDSLVAAINELFGTVSNAVDKIDEIAAKPALPIARGESNDGIAYTATGDDLPVVLATSAEQSNVGKGRQIVFVPYAVNAGTAPTLQLNGGEIIPIRLRAPSNQGTDDGSPDATLPVPAGALMRGVPYTMTFCGKYWLVDSQIAQFEQADASMLTRYANALRDLRDGDAVAIPVINVQDGIDGEIATAIIERTAQEAEAAEGNVTVPTVERVTELIEAAIGDTDTAVAAMDAVIGGASE